MSERADAADLADTERATLSGLLDCLIPPSDDGALPGAGALGLADYVTERFRDALPMLRSALADLDAGAAAAGAARFVDLAGEDRARVLQDFAETDAGLLPALLFHLYAGYYQSAEVLEAYGIPGRPPHPKGYEMGPHDPKLLDPVRARGNVYRST